MPGSDRAAENQQKLLTRLNRAEWFRLVWIIYKNKYEIINIKTLLFAAAVCDGIMLWLQFMPRNTITGHDNLTALLNSRIVSQE